MSANFHPLVYLIDYIMGVIMWTLIGRVAMNIFQREDSEFFFMKVFVKLTDPLINLFRPITPSFIIKPIIPLYVAWFFYMFQILPYALSIRLFCNGNAIISSRKRNCNTNLPNFW